MPNEITSTATAPAGMPASPFTNPFLAQLRRALGEIAGKPTLMEGFTITATERARIRTEARQLRARCFEGVGDTDRKAASVAMVLAGFGNRADAGDLHAHVYLEAVDNVPAWAVEEVCRRFIRGETEMDARFPPTPPQLAKAARWLVLPLIRDCETLELIAATVDEEEFKRVANGFDRLREELAGSDQSSGMQKLRA
jgi:hypothetical protein